MDNEKIFARIVAASDGKSYIILKNFYCCILSADSLCSLLENPLAFIKKNAKEYVSGQGYPARLSGKLSEIPGLTLGYLTEERRLVCEHPEMICAVIQRAKLSEMAKQINISDTLLDGKVLDEKQLCIKIFLSLGAKNGSNVENVQFVLSEDTQIQILSEILRNVSFSQPIEDSLFDKENGAPLPHISKNKKGGMGKQEDALLEEDDDSDLPFTLCNFPAPPEVPASTHQPEKPARRNDGIPEHYINMGDLVKRFHITTTTVHRWKNEGKIHPLKDARGHLWFDPDTFPQKDPQNRGRKTGSPRKGIKKPPKSANYLDVQTYIRDNGFFSDTVRPFIRTMDELNYYLDNKYREMNFYGNKALTIPIDLDYYSQTHKATNRELIIAGESPVVPKLEVKYDLHHIGQRKESPIAIIPSQIHNGPKTYSIFHSGSTEEDIHSAAFAMQKKQFWSIYVHMCDEYGGYHKIPFVNENKRKH